MDTADRLRLLEAFAHFSDEHIDVLADCTAQVPFEAGASVFEEGEESKELYVVDQGLIRIQRRTPYGAFKLADLSAGELFGESSFVDGNPRSCQSLIADDSVLMPISPVAIEADQRVDQRFTVALYWAIWKSLSNKLRTTNETLASFFATEGGAEPKPTPIANQDNDLRVGLDAKRDLFREQRLSRMEINFLSTLSKEQKLEPDETLFREGEAGDRMYVILEGKVMISKQITGAGVEALAILERGDYFGEMALIDRQPRSAEAKAHDTGAVVLSISREVLQGILDIQKVSSLRLLQLLCGLVAKRLREIDDKLIGWYIFDAGSGESLSRPR